MAVSVDSRKFRLITFLNSEHIRVLQFGNRFSAFYKLASTLLKKGVLELSWEPILLWMGFRT